MVVQIVETAEIVGVAMIEVANLGIHVKRVGDMTGGARPPIEQDQADVAMIEVQLQRESDLDLDLDVRIEDFE